MFRERIIKKQGFLSLTSEVISGYTEQNTAEITTTQTSDRLQQPSSTLNHDNDRFIDCNGREHICGKEAACKNFPNNTSKCVCPHDLSAPTDDFKCPVRWTVPVVPRPINNIFPPTLNTTNNTLLSEAEEMNGKPYRLGEVIGVTTASLIVIGILGIFLFILKKKHYNKKTVRQTLNKSVLLANKYTPNPQYFGCTPPEVPIIRRENIIFLYDIGEGCFGKVYKGELSHEQGKEIVAVKVLKDSASHEAEEDFMREVEIMSTFRHENILSLIGVVLRDSGNNPWMVFEYMPYGDLAEVLRANSHQLRTLSSSTSSSNLDPLTKKDLHWITIQITSGMAYLSAQRFVHRDLACRNCLVGSDLVVKIADFGMSRDVYTCDYYRIGGSRMLPVRWMSPESVIYGRFTLESDVWSFGVVLWEVYSYGKQPYYGHNNEEVVKLILQGIILTPPESCPEFVSQIMTQCWKLEPRDRPRFSEILDKLKKAYQGIEKMNKKGSLPRPPQGPVTIKPPNALDSEGYLVPAPVASREYLQPLPPIISV
ncbi:tyrosine-protein kinase transmembrane receptor Ror-like isoform X2 [Chelonus insularis]|uniref:tyrosine-protein kinase transmembrane receptor Ror-like isoform X2 n=1 Tax=Chelonus insularis TaxID=460826 RepID=UPI001589CBE2|nr:tyrosine-protein kinase transmembrane receptor Ror-like isoform X2 [Chelonus insularis]